MKPDSPAASPQDPQVTRPLFGPDFCELRCPICTRARKGNRLARFLQSIEMLVTFGGCPWGRSRRRKYGVNPDQSREKSSK